MSYLLSKDKCFIVIVCNRTFLHQSACGKSVRSAELQVETKYGRVIQRRVALKAERLGHFERRYRFSKTYVNSLIRVKAIWRYMPNTLVSDKSYDSCYESQSCD